MTTVTETKSQITSGLSGLSPQFIMRASLARHIKDMSKPDDGANTPSWRTPESQLRNGESEIENLGWYIDYAEPGYSMSHGGKGILTADWNYFHRDISDLLERAGFEIEWRDEWSECSGCNKLVRTSSDSYHWQPYYVIENECELVCLDCVDWANYLESIEDNARTACMRKCNPADHGYELISDSAEYANGWFPGQDDDNPVKILARLQEQGREHIVFRIAETSQFYMKFEVWQKITEEKETNDAD